MESAKMILQKLLHPTKWILLCVPSLSFVALIFIFATQNTRSAPAYLIYGMSAYSLVIWLVVLPRLIKRIKTIILIAVIMLINSRKSGKKVEGIE